MIPEVIDPLAFGVCDAPPILEPFGPQYPVLGGSVVKFRRVAHNGLKHLDRDERRRYGDAVERAILALQRAEANRGFTPVAPQVNCASGTSYNTGEKIHAAMRAKQRAAIMGAADSERRKRTPEQWRSMYADAMKQKRLLQANAWSRC